MTANHTPHTASERVIDLDPIRRRHGVTADRMIPLLTAGDPLADAVVTELDLYGARARQALGVGLDESLYKDVVDQAGARRLQDLLDAMTSAPDDTSRAAIAAVISAQAHAPGAVLSEDQLKNLIHSVLRRSLGNPAADRLGIPDVPALLPRLGPGSPPTGRRGTGPRAGIDRGRTSPRCRLPAQRSSQSLEYACGLTFPPSVAVGVLTTHRTT